MPLSVELDSISLLLFFFIKSPLIDFEMPIALCVQLAFECTVGVHGNLMYISLCVLRSIKMFSFVINIQSFFDSGKNKSKSGYKVYFLIQRFSV